MQNIVRTTLNIAVLTLFFTCWSCASESKEASAQESEGEQSIAQAVANEGGGAMANDYSYAIGVIISSNLQAEADDINLDNLIKGLREGLAGTASMTMADAQKVHQEFSQKKRESLSSVNLEEGKAYLAKNKTKEGVVETASGLQYEVLKSGDGPRPQATDKVKVHYVGTFINGKEFDSSIKKGEPITFGLNQVIKGWTEGMQLMPVGSKYRFVIPSDLAYGPQGRGNQMPPNATLIFEVELLGIE